MSGGFWPEVIVIKLDADESAWLLNYMHEQENLPPEAMERKRRFLEYCAASALYCETFGRFPDWWVRDDLYDNPEAA